MWYFISKIIKKKKKSKSVGNASQKDYVKELKYKTYENALNNYVPKETIQQRHFEFSGSLPEKNILDTIKDFFCNIKWPSCCECNEISNEETNEINTNTLKTPLNARNK